MKLVQWFLSTQWYVLPINTTKHHVYDLFQKDQADPKTVREIRDGADLYLKRHFNEKG